MWGSFICESKYAFDEQNTLDRADNNEWALYSLQNLKGRLKKSAFFKILQIYQQVPNRDGDFFENHWTQPTNHWQQQLINVQIVAKLFLF